MPIEIRTATTADIAEMSAMMARAFQDDDPVSRYFFPNAATRPKKQRRMMAALIRHRYIPAGGADLAVENGRIVGVSLWHPHDAPKSKWWRQLIAGPHLLWAMGIGTKAGLEMDRLLTENSPAPDAVLWVYLGVEPSTHRSGVGAALSAHVQARTDREGRPLYGICKEGNLGFWTAMGCVPWGTARIGKKGPEIHLLSRPPAPVT